MLANGIQFINWKKFYVLSCENADGAGRVVSQSSIIKFSQKLNYTGFSDLKLAIHEAVVKSAEDDQAFVVGNGVDEQPDSLQKQLYNIKIEALLTTIELNDEKRILAAAKLLEKSKRIQIIALQQHVVDVLFSTMLKQDRKAKSLLSLSRKAVESL